MKNDQLVQKYLQNQSDFVKVNKSQLKSVHSLKDFRYKPKVVLKESVIRESKVGSNISRLKKLKQISSQANL